MEDTNERRVKKEQPVGTERCHVQALRDDEHLNRAESRRQQHGRAESDDVAARRGWYLVAGPMPAAAVVVALTIPPLSLAAVRWRRRLVMSLPWLVALSGLEIPIGGLAVRPEQLAACLL